MSTILSCTSERSNMASALIDSDNPLLDLSFLTEEEKEKIETVLKEDQELRIRDRIRLG